MPRNLRIFCWALLTTVAIHLLIYSERNRSSITTKAWRPNFTTWDQLRRNSSRSQPGQGGDLLVNDFLKSSKGDGSLYQDILKAATPFVEGHPKHVVLLAYQRVGSSFFGQIFDRNPNFFYIYEPLDSIYAEMYGVEGGRTVPSDIAFLADGRTRDIPDDEVHAAQKLLSDILNCRVSELPAGFLLHKYWFFLSEMFMPSWRQYRVCLQRHEVLKAREDCWSTHLSTVCPRRFGINVTAQEACKEGLAHVNTAAKNGMPMYGDYKQCLDTAFKKAAPCIKAYSDRCSRANLWITKTVRGSMEEVEQLMNDNPNTRIIHLVRDPRPVVVSRRTMISYRSIYTGDVNKDNAGDIVKEAYVYCKTAARDLRYAQYLRDVFPSGRVVTVIYEDFVQNPNEYAKAIYKYLDETIPNSIMSWIRVNTQGRSERRNAKHKMNAWKGKMTYQQAEDIVAQCQDFYDLLNYKWPYHD